MNAIQLRANGAPVNVWMCQACGRVYMEKTAYISERCCICTECGKCTYVPGGNNFIKDWCKACESKANDRYYANRMAKAIELTDYKGPVVHGDRYFGSVDEMIDDLEPDEIPEWVHTCDVIHPTLDADSIIQNLLENIDTEEPLELEGEDDFVKAVEAFNAANESVVYWEEDCEHKVRVTTRKEPRAAAVA